MELTDKTPWKLHRELKRKPIPSQDDIYEMALSYTDVAERSLFILLYLTAGRLSEVIPCKVLRKHNYKLTSDLKIDRNEKGSPIIESTDTIPINYPGITKESFSFDNVEGKKIMYLSIQNRKNRKIQVKQIPISMDKEHRFCLLLLRYIGSLESKPEINPDTKQHTGRSLTPLFNYYTKAAERIINKVNLNPHTLRSIRLSHLTQIYDLNAFELVKYAGWGSIAPADRYIRLSTKDIISRY